MRCHRPAGASGSPSGAHIGEILVWTDRGATLAALEFAWVTDAMPTSLPAIVNGRLSRPA
ncbi:hypothetical protein ACFV1H_15540 [Streptomyces virginiae]|uniref:hypothetical protein n=1 Tax=Streptomyces virginiae TaxID=1961 RepID=UPI0036C04035